MRHRENNQNLLTFSGHLEVLRKLLFRILGVTVCIAVIIFSLKNGHCPKFCVNGNRIQL